MYKTFADLRAKRAKGENGFTLIELLVVVVILGVLIAIAIPVYLNYRKGANDAAAESDVRNAISVMETCNASNGTYPVAATAVAAAACSGQTLNLSSGTTASYISNAGGTAYVLIATNSGGSDSSVANVKKTWCYSSAKGGSVAAMGTPPTDGKATLTSC